MTGLPVTRGEPEGVASGGGTVPDREARAGESELPGASAWGARWRTARRRWRGSPTPLRSSSLASRPCYLAGVASGLNSLRERLGRLGELVEELELELVDDPQWAEPSDVSYLNAADRADPEIMDNVEAMSATNNLIAWFGRDQEGFVGFWCGPSNGPIDAAPVVRLDTEGQYRLIAATVPDYLAISVPEDEFAATKQTLIDAGFSVSSSREAIWHALESFDDPNEYRRKLYNEGRARRGLPPI